MKHLSHSIIIAAAILGASWALAKPEARNSQDAQNLTRSCIPVSGHSTQLTITGASAATSELDPETVYEMLCDTDILYEMGDDAAATADTNSHLLPANQLRYFATSKNTALSNFVSAIQVAAGGTCYIRACL